MKQRILWIDALRGFLILIVILGHALQHGDYYHSVAWNLIYSFHMAAFFAVSGYANYWSTMNGKTLLRRTEQLLLPFFSWTLLVALRSGDFLNTLIDEVLHPKMYWFIFALFFIFAIFQAAQLLAKRLKVNSVICMIGLWLILTGLMLLFDFRYLGFQYVAFYFIFFVMGYYVNHYKWQPKLWFTIMIGGGWFVLALFWRMQEVSPILSSINFVPSSFLIFAYRFVTAVLGSLFLLFVSSKVFVDNDSKTNNFLAYLGRESLGIYIIHIFIATYWSTYLARLLGSDTAILFVILDFFVKFCISIVSVELIKRIPYVRFFLFGIKHKK